jgi:hypothetical protein
MPPFFVIYPQTQTFIVGVQQGELKKKGLQKCSPFLFAFQMRVVSPKARHGELRKACEKQAFFVIYL